MPQRIVHKRVPKTSGIPPHFIVFVPGFLGSLLSDQSTGKTVWIDFSHVPLNPFEWGGWLDQLFQAMRYPNANLKASGIVDDVIFAQPWIKQEQYSRLLRTLQDLGYRADPARYAEAELNVYTFPYDWRQDNRISGRQLAQAIERWSQFHPGAQVWLMAHSNGGIVSRWYIKKEGGARRVSRLILLASPWDGAVKAMDMLFDGFDTLFRQGFNVFNIPERTRDVLRTFPSLYQLIPHKQIFLRTPEGEKVNPFADQHWLTEPPHRQLLADAKKFHRELGKTLPVDTLVFFGRQQPTTTHGIVHYRAGSEWERIVWEITPEGDGTLPEYTAIFDRARQNIPVIAKHGDIYVSPTVQEILRWELVDQYKPRTRAISITPDFSINFNPERDTYAPRERINVWATVHRRDETPVTNARIQVRLEWRQALPGSRQVRKSRRLPSVTLHRVRQTPGRYESQLRAPKIEGYYQLTASVLVPTKKQIDLQELIAVENVPSEL